MSFHEEGERGAAIVGPGGSTMDEAMSFEALKESEEQIAEATQRRSSTSPRTAKTKTNTRNIPVKLNGASVIPSPQVAAAHEAGAPDPCQQKCPAGQIRLVVEFGQ